MTTTFGQKIRTRIETWNERCMEMKSVSRQVVQEIARLNEKKNKCIGELSHNATTVENSQQMMTLPTQNVKKDD
jgi:hypothetical protein